MTAVVWLHGDSLSPSDPALLAVPDAPAVFVFDRPFLERVPVAFPRLAFMYQGVRDVAASRRALTELRVGHLGAELSDFVQAQGASALHVTRNHTPEWSRTLDDLRARQPGLSVTVHEPERLTSYAGEVRRFFGFWKRVEGEVLRPAPLYGGTLYRGGR